MTTLRVVLALICREFEFRDAYGEWDEMHPGKGGVYKGERVYQMESGAAHPVERYPCRVVLSGK